MHAYYLFVVKKPYKVFTKKKMQKYKLLLKIQIEHTITIYLIADTGPNRKFITGKLKFK
jgi:hypothetical protein